MNELPSHERGPGARFAFHGSVHAGGCLGGRLAVLFVLIPLAELALLMKLNRLLGWPHTVGLVVLTGLTGTVLVRTQGLRLLDDIRQDLAEGRLPAPRLLDGLMILAAGLLLITPGLITDAAGLLLLVPAVRRAVRNWLRRKLEQKLRQGTVRVSFWGA